MSVQKSDRFDYYCEQRDSFLQLSRTINILDNYDESNNYSKIYQCSLVRHGQHYSAVAFLKIEKTVFKTPYGVFGTFFHLTKKTPYTPQSIPPHFSPINRTICQWKPQWRGLPSVLDSHQPQNPLPLKRAMVLTHF